MRVFTGNDRRPITVDLFAGAGGLALGFEQAGFDVVASFDYDPVHCAIHAFNFPLTEVVCADLAATSGIDVELAARRGWERHRPSAPELPWEIDAIVGGPPCQGFSLIGKRLLDDERNALVFHFFRIVAELQPRFFVMENVPGMVTGGHRSILSQLIESFEEAGYDVVKPPRLLNAAVYGIPQQRERLFLLGARRGEQHPAYPPPTARPASSRSPEPSLFSANGGSEDFSLPLGPTVWEAIGDLPNLDDFPALMEDDSVELSEDVFRRMEESATNYVRRLRGSAEDPEDLSYPRSWNPRLLTSSQRTRHTRRSIQRFASTPPGDTEPVSRFYRLAPDGLCNTLRSGTSSERGAFTSPRPIHPVHPRVISVREAARLHSYPDWFRLHKTKWHGFRQIGNSVPPLLAWAVARQIVLALEARPPRPDEKLPLGDKELLALNMSGAARRFGADRHAIPQPRQRPAE